MKNVFLVGKLSKFYNFPIKKKKKLSFKHNFIYKLFLGQEEYIKKGMFKPLP